MEQVFIENARWEILGSKKDIVATSAVNRVSVKNVKKVAGPLLDENDESYKPYIFNGTCVYSSKIKVPRSTAYRFKFADVDLKTSYSFSELTKKKWKLTIKVDLNCDGLYGKKCSFTSR